MQHAYSDSRQCLCRDTGKCTRYVKKVGNDPEGYSEFLLFFDQVGRTRWHIAQWSWAFSSSSELCQVMRDNVSLFVLTVERLELREGEQCSVQ